ncbi:uncharacterized protein LOC129001869 [Macrosteles quadrilineatus]|uniref:uncharacterized protein LOC129001869 n=1 Tax=Macrosteles quadrilineatus TaxID=74068 RepID=UPI0023E24B9D|nr:uncharacterized protein LOC129001869 [Macrosteles quadrilineatus]
MKLPLITVGMVLMVLVKDSQQYYKSRAYTYLNEALIRGVADSLHHLSLQGLKYSEDEAKKKLFELTLIESIKNIDLFFQLQAADRAFDYDVVKGVIAETLASPEVQMGYQEILRNPLAPRVIGASVMGVTQLISDFVKMMLTRY